MIETSVCSGLGGFDINQNSNCQQKAKGACQPLQTTTTNCFGVPLPYTMTSPELVNENFTQQQLHVCYILFLSLNLIMCNEIHKIYGHGQSEMMRWEGLRSSPRCWSVVQPLLCSFYFPKCQDDLIELPPQVHTIGFIRFFAYHLFKTFLGTLQDCSKSMSCY
jgi:hypothetical protein